MSKDIIYEHARNMHPKPPVEITVEAGKIKRFSLNEQEEAKTYTHEDLVELFKASGVNVNHISIPIPTAFWYVPMKDIRIQFKEGVFDVDQIEDNLHLPEEAFYFKVER